jgi:DNA-binding CsgD family transcriptional regulator
MKAHKLSVREIQILKAVCLDLTAKQIAGKLHIGVSTVDFHKTNLYRKTKTKGVAGLVKFALRNAIIKL